MDQAQRLKDEGNAAYSAQQWQRADELYSAALAALGGDGAAKELRGTLHSNRCVARLRLERVEEALRDADECAALRGEWPRAFLRKSEALERLGRLEEATEACRRALQLAPRDGATEHRLRQLRAMQSGRFVFRQLLPGRELCAGQADPARQLVWQFATQMKNHIYLVGDVRSRLCVVVDPCWDVAGIVQAAQGAGLRIAGAVLTHYHFDHSGGKPPAPYDKFGITVEGVADICRQFNVPVFVGASDVPRVAEQNGVPADKIKGTGHLDTLVLGPDGVQLEPAAGAADIAGAARADAQAAAGAGGVRIRLLQTPGHTPGSQCLLVNGRHLLSGDTLFIKSCGRLDLPDCDSRKMYESLQALQRLPDDVTVWPGHDYGGPSTTIGEEKSNGFLRPMPLDQWLRMH